MGRKIHDDYARNCGWVTRQRLYQLRREREGKCIQCGKPRTSAKYCDPCRIKSNNRPGRRNKKVSNAK